MRLLLPLRTAPGLVALLATYLLVTTGTAADSWTILPGDVTLHGPHASQRLLLEKMSNGVAMGPVEAAFQSSAPEVVKVVDGALVPCGNGEAVVTAEKEGNSAAVRVVVRGMDEHPDWNFRHHVQAVLAKAGCNSGACHGALAGKGGFKLSLRGYDTPTDYHTITRKAGGRRIELSDPGSSLLLTKPSGAIPHRGGLRFDVESREYQILSEWIAAGAPGPSEQDPQLERVEILPELSVLTVGVSQPLLVRAHYSDGHVEDVTRWAKYTSADETVAQVDEQGQVTVIGHGEGAVTAWFASRIVIARVTSPYPAEVPEQVFAQAERRNFIDDMVLEQLQRLHLPPSPPAGDAEFLRRAYLDTIGLLPTAAETREFLADSSPDKRDRLIETLLSRPEFVDYWSYKWSDVLLVSGEQLRPQAVKAYYQWIRQHVAANTPWDKFARELVTSQGSTFEQGATNFFALHQDPETMSENVAKAFLGLSINCAKCHNHPLEKWTNDQYYAMANLFARVRAKGWGGDPRSGDGLRTVLVVDKGDLVQPRTGKPQPPTPLDGQPIPLDDPGDRRVHLAAWLTSPDNPYFARAVTNRVWANFFGVGLVEPVDDLRTSNPASNDALLQAAASFLVANDFDLKVLMRLILQSKTYQRSSLPLPENQAEQRFYSRYYPRRLMAEVMLDAVSQVTEVPTEFTEIAYPGADRQKTDFYPHGTRALQLYDSAVSSYFLRTFGRNQRLITCECERSDEPSMVQVLHISNGDTLNQKLQSAGNRIDRWLEGDFEPGKIVEEAFLTALSRFPTDEERQQLTQLLAEAPAAERRQAVEDLVWGVLSSREFLFHH